MTAPHTELTPSRLRRFACMMYEAVLLFGVVFLAGYLFDTLTQSKHALMLRHARQAWLFLAIGAYFVLRSEERRVGEEGRTVGAGVEERGGGQIRVRL